LIIVGRENFDRIDTSKSFIIVDNLDPGSPIGTNYDYDGDIEEENFSIPVLGVFTIDFYGTNALTNAKAFIVKQRGQLSLELQRDLKITVFHTLRITNLKSIDGSTYNDRRQIEVNVQYNEELTVDTLRIDTAAVNIINDK